MSLYDKYTRGYTGLNKSRSAMKAIEAWREAKDKKALRKYERDMRRIQERDEQVGFITTLASTAMNMYTMLADKPSLQQKYQEIYSAGVKSAAKQGIVQQDDGSFQKIVGKAATTYEAPPKYTGEGTSYDSGIKDFKSGLQNKAVENPSSLMLKPKFEYGIESQIYSKNKFWDKQILPRMENYFLTNRGSY